MLHCQNFKSVLLAEDRENSRRLIVRTRCKMWTCQYCAEKNRQIWRARIIDHINKNSDLDWAWFTLTAHSKKRGAERSLKNLRSAWDALMKRIKRKFSYVDKIHYCRVYEQHKDGSYHLHCIISIKWVDLKIRVSKKGKKTSYSKWLAKTAKDLKIGYYTHAANFDGEHAGYIAGYVVKYMTKLSKEFKQELGRIRHIQTSQDWAKDDNEVKYDWEIHSAYFLKDFQFDINRKYDVIDINTGEAVTSDEFLDNSYYPSDFAD